MPSSQHQRPAPPPTTPKRDEEDEEEANNPLSKTPTPIWQSFTTTREENTEPVPAIVNQEVPVAPRWKRSASGTHTFLSSTTQQSRQRSAYDVMPAPQPMPAPPLPSPEVKLEDETRDETTAVSNHNNEMGQSSSVRTDGHRVDEDAPVPRDHEKHNIPVQDAPQLNQHGAVSELPRPVSPLQSPGSLSPLKRRALSRTATAFDDMPVSPIVRDFSNQSARSSGVEAPISPFGPHPAFVRRPTSNLSQPRPYTVAVSNEIANQLARNPSSGNQIQTLDTNDSRTLPHPQQARRSLALEKQDSAKITETEIHPAFASRTSSYGGNIISPTSTQIGRPNDHKRRGSSVGPPPPKNISRLPPNVQRRYSSYASYDAVTLTSPGASVTEPVPPVPTPARWAIIPAVPTTPGDSQGQEASRRRSKSPFARWRERSRSRDASKRQSQISQYPGSPDSVPNMPAYLPSEVTEAATAALVQRNSPVLGVRPISTTNATFTPNAKSAFDATTPVSPAAAKRRQSPFARFRDRSRGRSFGATSQTAGRPTSEAVPTTPTRPSLFQQRPQNSQDTTTSEPRGRNRLRKKSVTPVETSGSPVGKQRRPTMDKDKTKRRSWYNQFLCYDEQGMPTTAAGEPVRVPATQADETMQTSRTENTNGLDIPQDSVPIVAPSQSESRQEYEQARSPSVSRRKIQSMSEEERQAHVRYLRERAGFAARPEETKPVEEAKQVEEAKPSMDEYGMTNEAWSEPRDSEDEIGRAQTSEDARLSVVPIGAAIDEQARGYAEEREQQSQRPQSYTRPWATPNHQRQDPRFLEHKQWRSQQLEGQQSSDQVLRSPAVGLQHHERGADISNLHQSMLHPSQRTQPSVSLYTPSAQQNSHQSSNNNQEPQAHQQTHTQHISPQAQIFSQPQLQPQPTPASPARPYTTAPTSPIHPSRRSDFPSPTRTSIRGLPSHLQHLRLSLSPGPPEGSRAIERPVSFPPAILTTPIGEPVDIKLANVPTSGTPVQEAREHHRSNSLATSVHVNVGHENHNEVYDTSTMPALPQNSNRHPLVLQDGPAAPVWDIKATSSAPKVEARKKSESPRQPDIAKWQRDVASASSSTDSPQTHNNARSATLNNEERLVASPKPKSYDSGNTGNTNMASASVSVMPGAWPLPNTPPVERSPAKVKAGYGTALATEKSRMEDVVLSPTLDGPGWEWRPDENELDDGVADGRRL